MGQEKEILKRKLFVWGGALDLCGRKQEEMKRLGNLRLVQRRLWLESDSERAREILEEIDRRYGEELQRIQKETEDILGKKTEVDRLLRILKEEERQFVELRFEKGYGFDYIALKLHMSRATVFRLQERVLNKLLQVETP